MGGKKKRGSKDKALKATASVAVNEESLKAQSAPASAENAETASPESTVIADGDASQEIAPALDNIVSNEEADVKENEAPSSTAVAEKSSSCVTEPDVASDEATSDESDSSNEMPPSDETSSDDNSSDEKASSDDDDEDSIDWLTIVLMIAVMANIAYWIWMRDTIITGDVEMRRLPGVNAQADEGGAAPGPNEGQDNFSSRGFVFAKRSENAAQDEMVRTYIVIANALEIAGYGEVRTIWELDKQVMEAARNHSGHDKEMQLTQQAYNEALRVMRTSYQAAFDNAKKTSNPEAIKEAEVMFAEAQKMNDSEPLKAMSRYEDAILRLRADAALNNKEEYGRTQRGVPENSEGTDYPRIIDTTKYPGDSGSDHKANNGAQPTSGAQSEHLGQPASNGQQEHNAQPATDNRPAAQPAPGNEPEPQRGGIMQKLFGSKKEMSESHDNSDGHDDPNSPNYIPPDHSLDDPNDIQGDVPDKVPSNS